ncbi:response regulator transcription factor [Xanthobacter versatilis]|uniref:Two component transcriptional regulator, winged helix family n=1 Tax=Xanthobacter autotrophicus (strain ATCC BAA-1158 / Py2) TaxID=78245 RepID=A7IGA5_XANP2|nr:two component transcriptional regulator, winged helix family [Xanthobacter autotrophicus Py2]
MNILVVEDDSDIGAMLSRGLSAEGFDVTVVGRADEALEAARQYNPCAVVLDIMLPDGSGIEVCRALREAGHSGPILFLSAKDEVRDRAEGLGAGADDYIVKPFEFAELVARLRAHLLHRLGDNHAGRIVAGRLVLDQSTRTVLFGEIHARLTEREAELLALLMATPNRPVPRGEIFDRLWANQGGASLNVVDVYVGYLRTKLAPVSRAGGPQVSTVRGRGFMLDLSAPAAAQ